MLDEDTRSAPTPPAPASLDAFLAGIGTRAFRFAEASLRNRDDALDAVQEAMMKMMGYADKPSSEWTPLFWSILRNKIIDAQRRGKFRFRLFSHVEDNDEESRIDWADPAAGPVQVHDQQETYAKLAMALRRLPDRQREAFTLRVLEELDVAETARVMGCSEGSVKTHLSRARDALKKQLEDVR